MSKFQVALAVIILAIVIGIPVLMFTSGESRADELEKFLDANKATPEERVAYRFAHEHPEVLKAVPCYCGCSRQGHKSNLSCFIQEDPVIAKKAPFDEHGFVCPMCLQIALSAKDMKEKGVPVSQIREEIDNYFHKNYPKLHPTPTPKPKAPAKKAS